MKQQVFNVSGMSCAACSARVEKVVGALSGTREVQVNLLTRSMRVSYDETQQSEADIIASVEQAGYGARLATDSDRKTESTEAQAFRKRFLYSLLFLIPLMLVHHLLSGSLSLLLQLLLLLPILWINRGFLDSGIRAVLHAAPNMNTLISLGALAGIIYSGVDFFFLHSGTAYLDSAGMIFTLISLGKWLESRATASTGNALEKLKAILPQNATIIKNGATLHIPARDVCPGDELIIAAGARIPVDAKVIKGISSIDESTLTGESMPVLKQAGDTIYAGTINGNATLHATALHTRDKSALSNIIHLVGETAAAKAPIARLADRISAVFVPVVLCIALVTALLWLAVGATLPFSMGCAIAVLVISCPCALGLATPVAIMAGAGKGAQHGLLFRSATAMETAHKASAIILDKTGTLSAGQAIVTGINPTDQVSKSELMQLAITLEQHSSHPLAQAITKACHDYTPLFDASALYHPGRGISVIHKGMRYLAGNAAHLQENGVKTPEFDSGSMTPIHFARGTEYMGNITISDPLKDDSITAVKAMQADGLRVIIMSGDHEATVRDTATRTGISEYYAGVLPQDKSDMVQQLQREGHIVAMVGDGINDAPALTQADVGIAIGAGTDVAIESAGIILVRSELSDAVAALRLSRAVIRIIRQNLFWAFFYNVLAIPLAAGLYYPLLGWQLSPGIAAAAMSFSSLFVVCNALRLRHFNINQNTTQSMNNTITISVQGMMCPHCERHVTQALSAIPGIDNVVADHKSATVTLTCSTTPDETQIAATIQQAGYDYKGRI